MNFLPSKPNGLSPVQNFYKNKCVFITGASGFVGKSIVEKLLRTCGEIQNIYILLRPKKNLSVEQRLDVLVQSSIFDTLKKSNPNFQRKITAVAGDTTLPSLGIATEQQLILQENVNLVFHCAATIKFNESLKSAMDINFHGTRRLMEFCKGMRNLSAFVHISTAYTNSDREEINEIVYPFMNKNQIDQLVMDIDKMDEGILNKLTPNILKEKPNTYVFTKAVVENYLEYHKDTLPIAIVRPSIVTATVNEPVAGWIDNVSALSGLLVFVGKGLLRSFNVRGDTKNDLIPVDYLANLIILAGWQRAIESHSEPSLCLKVYNGCAKNPITFHDFSKAIMPEMVTHPFDNALWYPTMHVVPIYWVHWINDLLFHWLPAYLIDMFSSSEKKQLSMRRVYNKVRDSCNVLNYFMTREWTFHRDNVEDLHLILSSKDQRLFPLFVKDIQWPQYLRNYTIGLRKYTLKEDDKNMKRAMENMKQKYWMHQILIHGIALLVAYVFISNAIGIFL